MDARDTYGVDVVLRAADIVNCRCGGEGCELPVPRTEDVVRWQAEATDE